MNKVLFAVVMSSVLAGCAFPVISTELSDPSLRADRRTGSNLPPRWADTNVKYMGREEFERMTSGQGSREVTPR